MAKSDVSTASVQALKLGYVFDPDSNAFQCLFCPESYRKGHVFPTDGAWLDAETAVRAHMEQAHTSVLEALLKFDKKLTGLTDLQKDLVRRLSRGESDEEIVASMSMTSRSTVRNHRFALREREKQARVFVAIMELLSEKYPDRTSAPARRTEAGGPLKLLPRREKKRFMIIESAASRFEAGRDYSVGEVNGILQGICEDYATLRRHLIGYGYLERDPDGRRYWVAKKNVSEDTVNRQELKANYKSTRRPAGVYRITNRANGKALVESSLNLDGSRNRFNFEIRNGCLRNHPDLQRDWNAFGGEQFVFEVLEELEWKESGTPDYRAELAKIEKKWLDKLQPYGDRGYNRRPKGEV